MAQFAKGTISNRWLGTLLLGTGVSMIAVMLHHPDGVNADEATTGTMRWVHGSLMFMIILNSYAVLRFADRVKSRECDLMLGSIFYWIGIAAFLGGALVSGFAQSSVFDLYDQEVLTRDAFETLNLLAAILNQSLISLGLLSFGASGLIWAIPLISSDSSTKFVGGTSFIVGACLITFPLLGSALSVFTLTALTGLIVLWHGSIAIWFLQNKKLEYRSCD